MKILYDKFDKSALSDLPRALFEGRVIVVQTESEADKAVSYLLSSPLVGFDTETRPSFKRGVVNKVSLLQLSTDDTCFLFRLNYIGLPSSVVQLLQNGQVTKIGLSLNDDYTALRRRAELAPQGFLDLQQYVKDFGIADMSLQKLYANIFGQKIVKRQRLTNWEADVLSDGQKLYAATDAWACLRIYRELEALRLSGDYELRRMPQEPEAQQETNGMKI